MNFMRLILKNTDIAIAVAVIGVLIIMLVPMPPIMLDLFLSMNITIALVALLIVFYTERAIDFSVFPSFLLLATLFRLALNVASTRRILLYGDQGSEHVGKVIESFGKFVVGGNYVVGFVVFLILVIIQFVVITKGASRIAEVAARFTLDAMPMKQMSIDTDLNAGIITEEEARTRRTDIAREAEFYGSMDGGSKFVRGDAVAGLIITAINLIGGLVIGVLQKGLSLSEATKTYSLLTIGDGLVSQIPALLISTAAGILMTRASSDGNLGSSLTNQFMLNPKPLGIAAVMLAGLGVVPGLPPLPFFALAGITGGMAYMISRHPEEPEKPALAAGETPPEEESDVPEDLLKVERISLIVGFNLVKIARDKIVPRIRIARRQIASELGLVVPPIRILDNPNQRSLSAYEICIRENVVARYELMPNHYLAMELGPVTEKIEGIPAQEPVSETPALWIPESEYERAQMAGYLLVDATAVLVTHLIEVIRSHAHELLSHQDVQEIIERVESEQPTLVKDIRDMLAQAQQPSLNVVLHRVLQNLLRESVPIRDAETILEALGDSIPHGTDTTYLTESVRQALSRTICRTFADDSGRLNVIMLDTEIEQNISQWIQQGETDTYLVPEPEMANRITDVVANTVMEVVPTLGQTRPIIACYPKIRAPFSRFIAERFNTSLVVLSINEVAPNVPVEIVAHVSLGDN